MSLAFPDFEGTAIGSDLLYLNLKEENLIAENTDILTSQNLKLRQSQKSTYATSMSLNKRKITAKSLTQYFISVFMF